MIVRKDIDISKPLTPEQRARISEASKYPIVFDEDCPELTDEQLSMFKRVDPSQIAGVI